MNLTCLFMLASQEMMNLVGCSRTARVKDRDRTLLMSSTPGVTIGILVIL